MNRCQAGQKAIFAVEPNGLLGVDRIQRTLLLLIFVASSTVAAEVKNGFHLDDALVPVDMIQSGGPPRDGIPALSRPRFVSAKDADFLERTDRVLGIALNGISRAYPIRILNYHEIVNDRFGDESVVVTFCPLCGTGIVFRGSIAGVEHTFAVSGLLYNSDVLLYDHQTESLWSQIGGRAISGPRKGTPLERLPVTHTTWEDWLGRHPDTRVLSIDTGYNRNYYRNPYRGYASSAELWFPVTHEDDRYPSKEMVIGLEIDGQFKAYALSELPRRDNRIYDQHAGQDVVVEYDRDNLTGRVLDSRGDEIPTFTAFWFAWVAFHPDTAVWQGSSQSPGQP